MASPNTAAVLSLLPRSCPQIRGITGLSATAVFNIILCQYQSAPRGVHIGGWTRNGSGLGRMSPVWHAGPGDDVPRPGQQPLRLSKRPYTTKRDSAANRAAVLAALPGTRGQLAMAAGLTFPSAAAHLAALVQLGLAEFDGWAQRASVHGCVSAIYRRKAGV